MLLYTQFSYKTTRKVFRTIFTSFINNFKSIRGHCEASPWHLSTQTFLNKTVMRS